MYSIFSYCRDHRWRKCKYSPKKKSIFAVPEEIEGDEAAGDDDDNVDNFTVRGNTFCEEISGVSRMVAECKKELMKRPKTEMDMPSINLSTSADSLEPQGFHAKFPVISNDLKREKCKYKAKSATVMTKRGSKELGLEKEKSKANDDVAEGDGKDAKYGVNFDISFDDEDEEEDADEGDDLSDEGSDDDLYRNDQQSDDDEFENINENVMESTQEHVEDDKKSTELVNNDKTDAGKPDLAKLSADNAADNELKTDEAVVKMNVGADSKVSENGKKRDHLDTADKENTEIEGSEDTVTEKANLAELNKNQNANKDLAEEQTKEHQTEGKKSQRVALEQNTEMPCLSRSGSRSDCESRAGNTDTRQGGGGSSSSESKSLLEQLKPGAEGGVH